MDNNISLLEEAANEIIKLRQRDNIQKARLDMFDDCIILLTSNVRGQGMVAQEDVLQKINKAIEESKIPPQTHL